MLGISKKTQPSKSDLYPVYVMSFQFLFIISFRKKEVRFLITVQKVIATCFGFGDIFPEKIIIRYCARLYMYMYIWFVYG